MRYQKNCVDFSSEMARLCNESSIPDIARITQTGTIAFNNGSRIVAFAINGETNRGRRYHGLLYDDYIDKDILSELASNLTVYHNDIESFKKERCFEEDQGNEINEFLDTFKITA